MKAQIVVDLGFGDSGKGTTVDFLATKKSLVVKYCGGPQNAHNVINEGRHHCFSQFGSGTFKGAGTFISKYCYVDPIALFNEAAHLEELGIEWDRLLAIDGECLIVTPYHAAINQAREYVRTNKHGSCGRGINETVRYAELFPSDALRVEDFMNEKVALLKIGLLKQYALDEVYSLGILNNKEIWELVNTRLEEYYEQCKEIADYISLPSNTKWLMNREHLVFEGSQGVLLDQDFGFFPHVTRSYTTDRNARELLKEYDYKGDIETIGVIRTYMTRHGYGPFVTEADLDLPEEFNKKGTWQGDFRVGYLDLPAIKYAIRCCKQIDYLSVTHMDRMPEYLCTYYTDGDRINNVYPHWPGAALTNWVNRQKPILDEIGNNFEWMIIWYLERPIRIFCSGPEERVHKW